MGDPSDEAGAAGLWRVGAKRESPGWGVALVRNPLELTVRV